MWRLLTSALIFGLVLAACGGNTGSPASGVRGVVRLGPQCPVEIAGSPCPDDPFTGSVRASTPDGEIVAETETDADGRFELVLEPGSYVLQAAIEGGSPPVAVPLPVEVAEGRFEQVTLEVDTGIR